MKNPKATVRERLVGKPLIGFNTRSPRVPGAMVGLTFEIRPDS